MKARKRAGTVGKVLGCALLLVIALFPIYWLVAMAIRPTSEMQGHISLIPQSLTIEHFISLFVSKGFGQAAINSLQTTLSSLVLSLIVGICAAYILARRRFRFGLKRPMTYWVLLVRVLPPVAFTIPLYTMFSKIGLLNTKIPVTLACVLINYLVPHQLFPGPAGGGGGERQGGRRHRVAALPQDRPAPGGAGYRRGSHAVLHVRLE